jgi:hypothetical protein
VEKREFSERIVKTNVEGNVDGIVDETGPKYPVPGGNV